MYRITSHEQPKVGGSPACLSCEVLRNPHHQELLSCVKIGQRQVWGCCEHGHEPLGSIKCGTGLGTSDLSTMTLPHGFSS